MTAWTIEEPRKLTFDTVRRLRVRTLAGRSGHVSLLRREPELRETP
jgi:hypothetical protein